MEDPWTEVLSQARSARSDYALDSRPLDDSGGQAVVFKGTHKPTHTPIAMKRPHDPNPDAVARMKREIKVGRALDSNRNVMPVLDASVDNDWFVMPLAKDNAAASRELLASDRDQLRRFVTAVGSGLEAAHSSGWVHRDVKPENILRLAIPGNRLRWVVADWGLGRGPRGGTTVPGRTRIGAALGTEGFAAPELAIDAHQAGPEADIYSLGQVIGWVLTGTLPQPNISLLPPSGPWRSVVRRATAQHPAHRPQTVKDLMELIGHHLDDPEPDLLSAAEGLAASAKGGNNQAALDLLQLGHDNAEDYDLHIDVISELSAASLRSVADTRPDLLGSAAQALGNHLGGDWGSRDFKHADQVILFLYRLALASTHIHDLDLLEDAAEALFKWDDEWNQFRPQNSIQSWLRGLRGEEARVVASVLRSYPQSREHFREVGDDRRADERLRATIRAG
ncbi:serine/threonine-protein kinase [Aquihabitans sp. McL0605]|uniref:serine/threonine-protein kinase n=1 Tax=Aquihabitans sp. McL0605 TaxID=3415671 RepID=UPI003CF36874